MKTTEYPIEVGVDAANLQLIVRAANSKDGRLELAVALTPEGALDLARSLMAGALMANMALLERAKADTDQVLDMAAEAVLSAATALALPLPTNPESLQ